MGIVNSSMFDTYKKKIQSLQSPFQDSDLRSSEFLLERDEARKLAIYYAPFEYLNTDARVLIAGITPGMHQMGFPTKRSWN